MPEEITIQRTDLRLKPRDSHPFFRKNPALWESLNAGQTIEVPKLELESISLYYGDSILVVAKKKSASNKDAGKNE